MSKEQIAYNKQHMRCYKKTFKKIKEYIDRDFSFYDKEYSFDKITGFYQVTFFSKDEPNKFNYFFIKPYCYYQELKKEIVSTLNYCNFKQRLEPKICQQCSDESDLLLTPCTKCSFIICLECSDRIYVKNCCIFICPKCDQITLPPPNISVMQRMMSLHYRRLIMGLESLKGMRFDPSPKIEHIKNKWI